MKKLTEHVFTWRGSVWGGVLLKDGHALLIDAPEFPAGKPALDAQVDGILLTQHRRAHSGGASAWNAPVWATAGEEGLQVGRASIFDDGNFHYVLSTLAAEETAGELRQDIQEIFASCKLLDPDLNLNTGS